MIFDCSYCMARILGVFGSGKGKRESMVALEQGAYPIEFNAGCGSKSSNIA
jgi:hypothetical protein